MKILLVHNVGAGVTENINVTDSSTIKSVIESRPELNGFNLTHFKMTVRRLVNGQITPIPDVNGYTNLREGDRLTLNPAKLEGAFAA
jgi:hypothetical protein